MNFHQTANTLEAILWAVIGCVFLWQAVRRNPPFPRNRCLIAAAAFLTFGLSDVIEITTGAWWRPWWLFAMKAACVLVLVGLYIDHVRSRRKSIWPNDSPNRNLANRRMIRNRWLWGSILLNVLFLGLIICPLGPAIVPRTAGSP